MNDKPSETIASDTPRVLLGIWSYAGFKKQLKVRNKFRLLFETFANRTRSHDGRADPRICNLGEFLEQPEYFHDCKVVYTFVIGAADPKKGLNQIVTETTRPLLVKGIHHTNGYDHKKKDMTLLNIKENLEGGKSQTFFYLASKVINHFDYVAKVIQTDHKMKDMTLLNIKENLEGGKSQTFFYFAQTVIDHFDYVAKCDSDSLLDLLMMFDFLDNTLPRPPQNIGIIAGAPFSKGWWEPTTKERKLDKSTMREKRKAEEGFLQARYGNYMNKDTVFHIYPRGEFYMFSADLVHVVVNEVRSGSFREYCVGVEDHDIGTMAQHSPNPIRFIFLSSMDKIFWDHPVKIKNRDWIVKWDSAIEKLNWSPNATVK
eukprot:CAMPEP_0194445314 /NCGR_PEP_ID=MMETSP0176-20130528/127786_1 /TAXON_ID=216777 /ORGANISM="Proboscia alata, Strain PI-D3" /LENGTH=371 /DNA_ID=CAMNT_0039271847 /DNA_START=683 /DNA_END=1799 /DNA_ORIENTATION=-